MAPRSLAVGTALLALAALTRAQTLTWIGQTFDGASVNLYTLTDAGALGAQRGSVALPAGATIGTDLFRCQPYGTHCQFIYVSGAGAATLVNTTLDGQVVGQVALPPADSIVSLHVDHNSDTSFFTALTGPGAAAVMSVANDGTATTFVYLSSFLAAAGAGATIKNGGATHCSNTQTMWVAVSNVSSGAILTIDLATRQVTKVTPLAFPGFDAMWADCAEFDVNTDVPGGIVFDAASQTLRYGIVGDGGAFVPQATGKVAGGLVPNDLLTCANVFSTTYNYAAPLYPPGTKPGGRAVKGTVAFFDFDGPDMTFSDVNYFLAGASLS